MKTSLRKDGDRFILDAEYPYMGYSMSEDEAWDLCNSLWDQLIESGAANTKIAGPQRPLDKRGGWSAVSADDPPVQAPEKPGMQAWPKKVEQRLGALESNTAGISYLSPRIATLEGRCNDLDEAILSHVNDLRVSIGKLEREMARVRSGAHWASGPHDHHLRDVDTRVNRWGHPIDEAQE